MTILAGATLAIAVLGAGLGIINTWHTLDNSRVKLKVVPGHAIPTGNVDSRVNFYVAVTNLSTFPVTVKEVGIFYRGTSERAVFTAPIFLDRGSLPRRLEPRSSVSVYGQAPEPLPGARIKCAYAKTECGVTTCGKSPALRQIAAAREF